MQNVLDDIIRAFSRDELRQFKYFVSRNGNSDKKQELDMITRIRNGEEGQLKRTNANFQVRKRLKVQLKQFTLLENLRYDKVSEVNSLIELSKYLFRKNLHELAWKYLFKAERMAMEMEEYELLDFIYGIQVSYSAIVYMPVIPNHDTPRLLSNRNRNLSLTKMDSDANAVYAMLLYKIREQMPDLYEDMDKLVNDVLRQYDLDDKIYSHPKIYIRVVRVVCMVLHEKKNFTQLNRYAMNSYTMVMQRRMTGKVPKSILMELIFFIYTSALKTKDYRNCYRFLRLYEKYTEELKGQYDQYHTCYFTANINMADLYFCSNRLADAKERLIDIDRKYSEHKSSAKVYYVLRVNLLALHFKDRNYAECIKVYNKIMQPKLSGFIKIGGVEIVLYTEIYGAVIYYENEDHDHALYLIQKIKAKYPDLLKSSQWKREMMFIRILEKMINKPSYPGSNYFTKHYEKFTGLKEYVPGDKEYISLNAWLTSKQTGKTYYKCFLELMK